MENLRSQEISGEFSIFERHWLKDLVSVNLSQEVLSHFPKPSNNHTEEMFYLFGGRDSGYRVTHIVAFPQEDWQEDVRRESRRISFPNGLPNYFLLARRIEEFLGQRVGLLGFLHTHPSGNFRLSPQDLDMVCAQSKMLNQPVLTAVVAPLQSNHFDLIGVEAKPIALNAFSIRRLHFSTVG